MLGDMKNCITIWNHISGIVSVQYKNELAANTAGMKIWEVQHGCLHLFSLLQEVLLIATVVLKHTFASMIFDSQNDPPPVGLFCLLLQNWFYIDMFCYHVYLWVMIVVSSPTCIINQHR